MRIRIRDIAYHLPERVLTNEDLHRENPAWDMALIEERSGVSKRYISRDDETALDLAVAACRKLFRSSIGAEEGIDGLIFCTQSADHILPPNSCILHKELGLPEDVFACDINLACSGYVYGLALSQGLAAAGIAGNILLVTADTYSKYINEKDRSTRVLFSDGAAVSWLEASDSDEGVVDLQCSTYGGYYDKFIIPAGGCRMPRSEKTATDDEDGRGSARSLENIRMDGMSILAFINSKVPGQIRAILKRNGLKIEEIDLFVFHQASKMALDSLTRILRLDPDKVFRNIRSVGNTVSASIPIALRDAMDCGKLSRGDLVMLSGFGVGLSWAAAVVRF